jgi:hypothetical protein
VRGDSRRLNLPGNSEENGVGDLTSSTGDENTLGLIVEAGLLDGHGSGGLGHHAGCGFGEVGDHFRLVVGDKLSE